MSAETLRKAAERLRAQADTATPGPWSYKTTEVLGDGTPFGDVLDPDGYRVGDSDDEGSAFIAFDGIYIATMHPGVGLALADWLDAEAAIWEELLAIKAEVTPKGYTLSWPMSTQDQAVAVAHLILGGAS